MKIAPCYYVTGNHEARVSECAELKAGLEAAGVVVLENERGRSSYPARPSPSWAWTIPALILIICSEIPHQ